METDKLKQLLEGVQSGRVDVNSALEELRRLPYENVDGFANLDHHRGLRNGFPEVVLGQGKQPAQVAAIVKRLAAKSDRVLVTRVDQPMADVVLAENPGLTYHPLPRLLVLDRSDPAGRKPGILVVTAGTADMPVAEEAAVTAELMNNKVERLFDVGVAGIHRLLDKVDTLWQAG
jgi:NCAIR mutase (PurE)-related protein